MIQGKNNERIDRTRLTGSNYEVVDFYNLCYYGYDIFCIIWQMGGA